MDVIANGTVVTRETFIRAESDKYFFGISQQAEGVNKLFHFRQVTPLDRRRSCA